MEPTLLGAAGLLVAGAITPGPNNLVVLRQAARAGWRGAAPAIAGIVAGGLALLALASLGIGVAVAAEPGVAFAIAAVGSLYLGGLGIRLLIAPTAGGEGPRREPPGQASLPAGAWGLFLFQFLNPKAWLLVLTVTSSAQAELGTAAALPPLVALFALVPTACLALWSWAGVGLRRALESARARTRLDRAMGLLLVACALVLLVQTWR